MPTSRDNSDDASDLSETDGIAASADELAAMAAAELAARGQLPTTPVTLASTAPDAGVAFDAIGAFDAAGGDAAQASDAAATEANRAAVRGLTPAGDLVASAQFSSTAATATTAMTATATDAATILSTASDDTANAAMSAVSQEATAATAALAANTNDAAQRARGGSARGPAQSAGSAQNAVARAVDPLARLIQSSQDAIATAQSGGAIAGRLAEVEAGIARDRAQRALSDSGASLSIDGEGSNAVRLADGAEPGADGMNPTVSAATGREASLATGALAPDSSRGGATLANSAIGAGIAGGPASDLAMTPEDASAPAAQLAAKGAEILARQRGGAITMRLEPPALGQLKIELRIAHGSVVADFTAATPEARVLLESSMGMLRERLESQGLGVERITVHGGRAHGEAAATQNAQQGDARSQGEPRGDTSGRQSDGGARQDAAGGESRGRRDGERTGQDQDHGGRGRNGSHASDQPVKRGFAGALADAGAVNTGRSGTNTTRTAESVRRAG